VRVPVAIYEIVLDIVHSGDCVELYVNEFDIDGVCVRDFRELTEGAGLFVIETEPESL